jgi:N-methylhydantoinase A
VGDALGLGTEAAARGIVAVGTAHLVRAIRRVSVERGEDPRGCTLVAYGGAGPMHAGSLLRELGLAAAVVPPHPGLFSASGLVSADIRVDDSQTVLSILEPDAANDLVSWYRRAAEGLIERLREDGIPRSRIRVVAGADCRYLGQGFELGVPLSGLIPRAVAGIAPAFHELHRATYGHAAHGDPIEVVTLRASAFGGLPRAEPPRIGVGAVRPPAEALLTRRRVNLPDADRSVEVPVYARAGLLSGNRLEGPGIIEEMDATTFVLPGQSLEVDEIGCLWVRDGAGAS